MLRLSKVQIIILCVVVGVVVLAAGVGLPVWYFMYRKPSTTAALSGFNYAACDGNYVFYEYRASDDQLLFNPDTNNLATNQDARRQLTVDRKEEVNCYLAGTSSSFGIGGVLQYDHRLWPASKTS